MACAAICPHGAIETAKNSLGFSVPKIIESKCVDCNLCQRVCPSINSPARSDINEVYAASAKDPEILEHTSSGGMATLISRKFIEDGGVVYGCSGKDIYDVRYVRIYDEQHLSTIQGSKYVQGSLFPCYKDIRKDLKDGLKVLIIGIPCQVAGLRNFLRINYENLYCVDIICHGAASQKMLSDNLEYYINKYNLKQIDDVKFRIKEWGEDGNLSIRYGLYFSSSEKSYCFQGLKDPFTLAYANNLSFRDSCYRCKYTNLNRVSDITLGDFWKLGDDTQLKNQLGVSLCILHSSKGRLLLESVKETAAIEKRSLAEAVNGNPQLIKPSVPGDKIDLFRHIIEQQGFPKAAVKVCRKIRIKHQLYKIMYRMGLLSVVKRLKDLCHR